MFFSLSREWCTSIPTIGDHQVHIFAGEPLAFRRAGSLVCRRCGVEDVPVISPAPSPHAWRASCRSCGAYIKWLATPRSEEQQEARREQAMAHLAPTEKQLQYLRHLRDYGPPPQTRLEASERIEAALKRKYGIPAGGR